MLEYKVIRAKVQDMEEEMNRFAASGWRVIAVSLVQGQSFTVNGTAAVITLERRAD